MTQKFQSQTHVLQNPDAFRKWLAKNYCRQTELWVGFYRRTLASRASPGRICRRGFVLWLDRRRQKGVDETSYKIRFSPRRIRSIWSAVNIRRVGELTKEGRMHLQVTKRLLLVWSTSPESTLMNSARLNFPRFMRKNYSRTKPLLSFSHRNRRRIAR